ncbi:armadillo repeat-containing X-linked protein 5 [Macaca fascicularis]|uniref:Armadillo repeat containing X-linked 5 n=1 Tax=Macaca fascicularis TaxID=9541 RepID=A0A2K5UR16_MACFA|nr:armadillo repeat-containing X-linked protein 5 [Macaca fascicularis]XP_005594261.1 armadillo repeat-containing X-linked protein 5 [Macaca fascicularis]XP_005594262.1 armadillo repeat-containing X-linked protein 5 [Macaca fascicularis]XP_045240126.1 armadillo repeat-containing X-linked protein 5 [Macaca fascicularis]XP_045240127.1 armadillo repeat-containing X-linked protein 5 [Macaca fascicularis]
MVDSGTEARARGKAEAGLQDGISGPATARVNGKTQAKAVAEAELKTESVTQAKAGDGAMTRMHKVTYREAMAVTREVSKMEDTTKSRVMVETKTKPLAERSIVPQTKSKAMPMSGVSAVTKSEVKVVAVIEANIRSYAKSHDKANTGSRPDRREEASIGMKSSDEDEENICSWFWTGEESSVGSWFWPEEETSLQVYKPLPKIQEKPKPAHKPTLTIKQKAIAWSRARYIVLVPIEGGEQSLPPEGNWTLVETLIETPLGIRPLTKIPPYHGPYYQTLTEIKKEIRQREKYGPNPKACHCKSRGFSLEPKEFDKLVALLKLTKDPFIHEIATMIMGISPAYPFTQDIIHDVGITVMIENLVNNANVKEHPRALSIVDDSSESSEEPKSEESYIHQVCKDIVSCPLNSPVQLAGLKLLGHLSVKFDDHYVITSYIPDFLTLLNKGSVKTKFYVLKVFSCLSKNCANTRELISAKVLSSLVAPFNKHESKANILNIIEIFENINFQFKTKVKLFTKEKFTKSELISIFQEAKQFGRKLQDLAEHSDPEVRDKVIRLILKL